MEWSNQSESSTEGATLRYHGDIQRGLIRVIWEQFGVTKHEGFEEGKYLESMLVSETRMGVLHEFHPRPPKNCM